MYMDKRMQVPCCLWTVLAAFVRRWQGLERNRDQVLDRLEGGKVSRDRLRSTSRPQSKAVVVKTWETPVRCTATAVALRVAA
eukprot:5866662-Pleurochrysis_carterae.AAC.2